MTVAGAMTFRGTVQRPPQYHSQGNYGLLFSESRLRRDA